MLKPRLCQRGVKIMEKQPEFTKGYTSLSVSLYFDTWINDTLVAVCVMFIDP
jgi:hypothetical protein